MSNAKVIFGNETLIDLTQDTASAGDVLQGKSFHLRSGAQATGTLDPVLKPDVATIEATSTASKPYSIGEYLYYDSTLYRVTAAISQGGSIVTSGANPNVTSVTIGGELDSVNSSLADKQAETLTTARTIGGTSRTTVEDALGALTDSAYLENGLTSSSTTKALTAAQGKALKDEADKFFVLTNKTLTFTGTAPNLSASVSDARITADTLAMVYFDSPDVASAAGIDGNTASGSAAFTATSTPSTTITCDIVCKNP